MRKTIPPQVKEFVDKLRESHRKEAKHIEDWERFAREHERVAADAEAIAQSDEYQDFLSDSDKHASRYYAQECRHRAVAMRGKVEYLRSLLRDDQ